MGPAKANASASDDFLVRAEGHSSACVSIAPLLGGATETQAAGCALWPNCESSRHTARAVPGPGPDRGGLAVA